ncbi:MAG: deoxyribonuclease IV, partial [Planctomycetota bacterium]
VAGGLHNALLEGERLRMETVQVFTRNQRQWKAKPLADDEIAPWARELRRLGWTKTISHASYLINLASPDGDIWEKSVDAMTAEVERCESLTIPFAVVHPGSHKGEGESFGIDRIARSIDEICQRTRGFKNVTCLETTVGGGNQIGGRFEHLAAILDRVAQPERVGVCLDTCHIAAAGYDISTTERAEAVFAEFDRTVGLALLHCIHVNDSQGPIGSHRDRHAHIGEGHVGKPGFAYVMCHPALRQVPKVLETPKGETPKGTAYDVLNLRRLRKMMRDGGKS